MGAILHLPQGGAQIAFINQIPETPLPGDMDLTTVLDTIGSYTYVRDENNNNRLVNDIWSEYESWEQAAGNGDMVIINSGKHYGLNFYPQSTQHPVTVQFMYMDRTLNFASNRVIGYCKMSEGSWTNTLVSVYLIPWTTSTTISGDMTTIKNIIDGGSLGNVTKLQFRHNGYGDANDDEGIMIGDLPRAGKYKIAIQCESSINNSSASVYQLRFRTY